MREPIVWHSEPTLTAWNQADLRDQVILGRLGVPADAALWSERDRADELWTFEVHAAGTLDSGPAPADASGPTIMRAIQIPEQTVSGLLWIRRIVEADGRVRVEDRWSKRERRYRRLIDPDDRDAKRLARYLFDQGPWGAGAPRGREKSLDETLDVILEYRRDVGGDPTQEYVGGAVGYRDVRSLQRALDGASWQEVLGFASQRVEAERAHPGATLIHGFVSVAGAREAKLSENSVLRKPRARPESW
jgi:hypothetical protein